ncbi:MAG: hypothetical protein ACFFAS_16720 [Promethearchaeota archaeon]
MKLENKEKYIITSVIFVFLLITATTLVLQSYSKGSDNSDELYSGFQVTFDEIPQSESIVILNPKHFNILYDSRYEDEHENILINYQAAPGVVVTEYVLDGGIAQPIPQNNLIPRPDMGNHTLRLIGTNSTGGSCSSNTVSFQISRFNDGNGVSGVLGGAPDCRDVTSTSSVQTVISYENLIPMECGLVTDTILRRELFLEGPERYLTQEPYIKSVDLKYELIFAYIPYVIIRSAPWYDHYLSVRSHPDRYGGVSTVGTFAKNGTTQIFYFLTEIFHVFGPVTFWNDETIHYDVIDVAFIQYYNIVTSDYDIGDALLECPVIGPVDYSQYPGEYYDKSSPVNATWEWAESEDWSYGQGLETEVFLGNYAGMNSCPVRFRFCIPYSESINRYLMPAEIVHSFQRTAQEPDNFEPNYRGLENTFSMNIILN